MIGSASDHASPKPVEGRARRVGVRLTWKSPAANAAVEFAKWFVRRSGSTTWRVVRPGKHLRFFFRVPRNSGFKQGNVGACLGEYFRGHSSTSAGPDDAHIVDLRFPDDLH